MQLTIFLKKMNQKIKFCLLHIYYIKFILFDNLYIRIILIIINILRKEITLQFDEEIYYF